MTDSNYTHILAIVDRSGSMSWGGKEMTEALNEYFKGQAEVEGKCLVDYIQFDNTYEKVYEDLAVKEAYAVIEPRGGTALLDAIGAGSLLLGYKLKALPEVHRPGKVQVVVVTDGHENSSRSYTPASVKKLIAEQSEKYGWDYVFLGANIDAVAVGETFGINPNKAITFDINNSDALYATSQSLGDYSTAYRGTAGAAAAFTDEDRKKALGK